MQAPPRPELLQLGSRIRAERHARGITQAALARTLKISVEYVSLIERGGRNPPYTTFVALARALQVSPATLVAE